MVFLYLDTINLSNITVMVKMFVPCCFQKAKSVSCFHGRCIVGMYDDLVFSRGWYSNSGEKSAWANSRVVRKFPVVGRQGLWGISGHIFNIV